MLCLNYYYYYFDYFDYCILQNPRNNEKKRNIKATNGVLNGLGQEDEEGTIAIVVDLFN